jgi:3-oxoacyl-[acyl-carrier protein] reductase
MDQQLRQRVAWITGASGGIGRELARHFHRAGARLVLSAGSRLRELEDFARAEDLPGETLCLAADVRDPAALEAVSQAALERFGRLDLCVANAGHWPSDERPLYALPPARFAETVAINLLGPAYTLRAFGQVLAACGPHPDGGGAAAVLIGSTAGRFGERGHSDYAAAKSGLVGLMLSLKNELVRLDPRARINLIEPGWTRTEMARAALDDPQRVRRALSTMALRQLGAARDVAAAAVFLCSPQGAAHITGQTLTIAGGMEGRSLWRDGEIDPGAARR